MRPSDARRSGFASVKLPVVRKSKSAAFTLIELLVVIAIIALLVSILLPSLRKAKELAKRVICASNTRHIGLAVTQYHMEKDGWLPMTYESGISGGSGSVGATYASELAPYLGTEGDAWYEVGFWNPGAPPILTCPSETKEFGNHICGYGWNWVYLGAYRKPGKTWCIRRKVDEVARPFETSCLGESQPYFMGWNDPLGSTLFWGGFNSVGFYAGARHNDGSNYLCVDGHVEYATYDDLVDDYLGDQRIFWRGELEEPRM